MINKSSKIRLLKTESAIALVFVASIALYFCLFEIRLLNPFSFGWLLQGDWGQHFIGWMAFLNEPWHWPPGRFENLGAPVGNSIVYTDSLPLLAIPLKALLAGQVSLLQFQGWWFLICIILQGVISYVVLRRLTCSPSVSVVGALLLLCWPPMYHRLGHDTLVAHWLLLAAMGVALTVKRKTAVFLGVGLVATAFAIHAYLAAMVSLILGSRILAEIDIGSRWQTVKNFVARKSKTPPISPRTMFLMMTIILVLGVELYLLGYFESGSSGGGGFGVFSMNLNALWNPQTEDWSRFIPAQPFQTEQHEGFLYLGVGLMGVIVVAFALALWQSTTAQSSFDQRFKKLGVVAIAAFIFALSSRVTFGENVLFNIGLPPTVQDLLFLSTFQSSGRFGWITGLVLIVWSIFAIASRLGSKQTVMILSFALALQLVDLSSVPALMRDWTAPLPEKRAQYEELAAQWPSSLKHIRAIPPQDLDDEIQYQLGFAAILNGGTTNSFYFARPNNEAMEPFTERLKSDISQNQLRDDTMYLSSSHACYIAAGNKSHFKAHYSLVVVNGSWFADDPLPNDWRDRQVTTEENPSLAELIASCGEDCTMVLAIKDDGSKNLSEETIDALASKGAKKVLNLDFRDSYLIVLKDGNVVTEELASEESVEWSNQLDSLSVRVESAGFDAGAHAFIFLDDVNCSLNQRGFNGVYWQQEPKHIKRFHVDTYLPATER
ncbi:hypothetical protein FRE64_01100 [Euhalothece natronophila Z-M001]|uniref:Uncharacterized protein n=1 Tax=Euhalothece natronophila Z-M001 TaxID=522448 RepID=A0A5B8NJX1_9CHRO|nr:DUF6311 domain-containing protein [Euhalothece natronophila]QDZ38660.1 hypothetical protein FRE64_01100 [Euhalothece natronophila Z-M001]